MMPADVQWLNLTRLVSLSRTRTLLEGSLHSSLIMTFLILLGSVAANAGVITGFNVHAQQISGVSNQLLTPADSTVPAAWSVGSPGFPFLDLTIDDNGLIKVTPNAQTCSSGCAWNVPGVYQFTFEAAAPDITALNIVHNDVSLDSLPALIDAKTFQWAFARGDGTTDVNFQTAQLTFAQAPVPEPVSTYIAGLGLAALGFLRRRCSKREPNPKA